MSSYSHSVPSQVTLTRAERTHLEAVVRKATSPQRDAFRAKIVLLAAEGDSNTEIGRKLSCNSKTARKWRERYNTHGRAGLADKPRPGRPPIYRDYERATITALACELPADRGLPLSRFSSRDIHNEAQHELQPCPARSTIAAWLKQAAIKPWTYASWVTPKDPQFEQKAAPVLDLYNGLWNDEPLTADDVVICTSAVNRRWRMGRDYGFCGECLYPLAEPFQQFPVRTLLLRGVAS